MWFLTLLNFNEWHEISWFHAKSEVKHQIAGEHPWARLYMQNQERAEYLIRIEEVLLLLLLPGLLYMKLNNKAKTIKNPKGSTYSYV